MCSRISVVIMLGFELWPSMIITGCRHASIYNMVFMFIVDCSNKLL